MTDYFVRKSGNDGSAGTSAGAAWLTIGKALGAAGIASGDRVFIGAGVYRETVTVAMTSAVAETSVIGDVDGAQTGDAGYVVWTAYTTNDKTNPSASDTLNLAGRDYLTFRNIIFVSGSNQAIDGSTATSTNITIRNCTILAGNVRSSVSAGLVSIGGAFATASVWAIDRCIIWHLDARAIVVTLPTGSGSDYDANVQITNCKIVGDTDAVRIVSSGASAQEGGGVDIKNCFILGGTIVTVGTTLSLTIPCTIGNSYLDVGSATALTAGESGALVEDYNLIVAATPRSNVSVGSNSHTDNYAPMFHVGQAEMMGFGCRPFGSPMTFDAPMMAFGDDGTALTTDLLGNIRPGGGRSVVRAAGCYEFADCAVKSTANPVTGSNHLRMTGPGQHDFNIAVDAASTTVEIVVEWDGTYTGTKPSMSILNGGECGVADATDTATGSASTPETLSLNFTPTSQGIVTLRLRSSDTNGGGLIDWDDLTVT